MHEWFKMQTDIRNRQCHHNHWVLYNYWLLPFNDYIKTTEQRTNIGYSNTVIGTLAVGGLAVTYGTVRRGMGGLGPRSVPS